MKTLLSKIWHFIGGIWGVCLLVLLFSLIMMRHQLVFEVLDSKMFALNAQFVARPDDTSDIVAITVPRTTDLKGLRKDYKAVIETLNLVDAKKPLAMALLLDIPVLMHEYLGSASDLLVELERNKKHFSAKDKKRTASILKKARQQQFVDITILPAVSSKNLFVGQHVNNASNVYFSNSLLLESVDADKAALPELLWLVNRFMPTMVNLGDNVLKDVGYKSLPVYEELGNIAYRPLVWRVQDSYMPSLVAQLYAKLIGSKLPVWEAGKGLKFDTDYLSTDWIGRILPRASQATGIEIDYPKYSLLDLLNKKKSVDLKDKVVIIGIDDDPRVDDLTQTLSSIYTGGVFKTPQWTEWFVDGLLIAMFLYAFLLLHKLRFGMAAILYLFIIFALLVIQTGMLLVQSVWMPVSALFIMLSVAFIISLFRRYALKKQGEVLGQVYEAFWMLGVYQYEQGEYDQSFASLQKCPTTDLLLEQMYRIGQSYEQRRQYGKALDLYKELNRRRRGYKGADKRIKNLAAFDAGDSMVNLNQARTLIMTSQGFEKPVLGRYELIRELGRGAMGVVYLGKDPKIVREVAIKTMDMAQYNETELPGVRERFFREAETAGRLNHPNIVTIYDVGEEQDLAFIAMDYVVGQVMSDFTQKGKLLPVHMVLKLMRQVAIALDYAHKQNVIHRDIKPSNIMYNTEEQMIKVADFGIARVAGSTGTHTGTILGSPLYMAPEQLSGIKVDGRADLFSLGVTMYQLLTGELPFEGDTIASLAYQVTNVKHPPIREIRSDLPPLMTRLINKLLQKDPDKRFATGKDVASAIVKVLSTIEDAKTKKRKPAAKKAAG